MQSYSHHLNILVLELEYALKTVFLRIGKTYKFQKLRNMLGFIQIKISKNLKIPDSLNFFFGFLHTRFYVCHIRIFTNIKYVFLPRKWLRKYVFRT